jgi:hypothetical protein
MSNNATMPPIALSDEQMSAVLAASYPLPDDRHSAFLSNTSPGSSLLPALGDGAVRVVGRGPAGSISMRPTWGAGATTVNIADGRKQTKVSSSIIGFATFCGTAQY